MCPVIDRVADEVRQSLGKAEKLLFVVAVTGDELLVNAVCSHNAPLVVVAVEPQFRQI